MKKVAVLLAVAVVLTILGAAAGRGYEWLIVLGVLALLAAAAWALVIFALRVFRPSTGRHSTIER